MEVERIQALFEYNRWANGRVLEVLSHLTPEEFTRDMGNSFRSLRDTAVHIMGAEWIWLSRCKGTSPKALPTSNDYPAVEHVRNHWAGIENGWKEFVTGLTENSLKTPITYLNLKGETYTYPLWQILQHLVNHSTYHRGQITTLLRQLGARPVSTDFLAFYDKMPKTGRS